jgi:glyoxylase-like metal-dependent hydrolase (beta-lactamase superfamily II)/rhodanese-related sulfurtransferase
METIEVDALRARLEKGESLVVLDIRPTAERSEWAIPGSLHADAYEALKAGDPEALAGVDLPGDHPIVTVCGAGKTSLIAARQFRARGLQAFSLDGGMKAWSLAWNLAEVAVPGRRAQVVQVRRTGKGCLSYVIGAEGAAMVIDPSLPPKVYLDLARGRSWRITHILETHVHADHLSRARWLAQECGAELLLPEQKRVAFPFAPVRDGFALTIGPVVLKALRTPGHTLESTCYLLDEKALFTGDTLFLAAVGRPDLHAEGDEARNRARALYGSLQGLLALPPETLVLPGHTSQPVAFDGRPVQASLAEVRARLHALRAPEEPFVEAILGRIPPTPPNYLRIVELNEAGKFPDGDPTDLEAGANRCAVS